MVNKDRKNDSKNTTADGIALKQKKHPAKRKML